MRALSVLLAIAAMGISAAPAHADAFKPSKSQQVKLGLQAAEQLRKQGHVLPDSDPRVKLVRRIGQKLLSTVNYGKDPWKFSFDVVDSKQVNAFALPGGPTFIYTGLLDKLETEDELAGVMGHEMTHVLKEHWAQQYATTQKRELGIGILLTVIHANNALQNIGSALDLIEATKYSRKEESQADSGGFDKVVAAGWNPEGMADVFRMFQKQKSSGEFQILSDHPSDKSRIESIEKMKKDSGKTFPAQKPLLFNTTTSS